jgi:hypothetical protein
MDVVLRAWILLASTISLAGCGDRQAQPAQEAIAAVESALAASGTAPVRYIPGEVSEVREGLDALKHSFEREDYAGVLRDAPALLAAARALPREAAAREAELAQALQRDWAALEAVVPAALEAARERVDPPGAAALPPGVSRADAARATRQVDHARALWERAQAERNAQRLPEAVTLGHQARELLERVADDPVK